MSARPPKSPLLCWWLLGGGLELFTLLAAAAIITAGFVALYTLIDMGYLRWIEIFLALSSGIGCIGMAIAAHDKKSVRR